MAVGRLYLWLSVRGRSGVAVGRLYLWLSVRGRRSGVAVEEYTNFVK